VTTGQTRTACPAHRLKFTERLIRNAFDWLHPDRAIRNGRWMNNCCRTSLRPEHPFHSLEPPACHGDGLHHPATPARTDSTEALPASQGKAPVTNLCSQLVVNEHPQDPTIPKRWTHTQTTAPSALTPCPARLYEGRNEDFQTGAE
jgi:hypothetical protein